MPSPSPETRTSTELLEALKDGGNNTAWSDFDARFRPILLAVVQRMGLRAEDAADVTQAALTEFFRDFRAGKYDRGRGRLRSWLISIARNRAIDLMRADGRHRGHRGDSVLMVLPDDETVGGFWDDEEGRAIAKAALEHLRAQSRVSELNIKIFELVRVRNMPHEQVAAECGVSIDQVYKATNRCGRYLGKIIEEIREKYDDGV